MITAFEPNGRVSATLLLAVALFLMAEKQHSTAVTALKCYQVQQNSKLPLRVQPTECPTDQPPTACYKNFNGAQNLTTYACRNGSNCTVSGTSRLCFIGTEV